MWDKLFQEIISKGLLAFRTTELHLSVVIPKYRPSRLLRTTDTANPKRCIAVKAKCRSHSDSLRKCWPNGVKGRSLSHCGTYWSTAVNSRETKGCPTEQLLRIAQLQQQEQPHKRRVTCQAPGPQHLSTQRKITHRPFLATRCQFWGY